MTGRMTTGESATIRSVTSRTSSARRRKPVTSRSIGVSTVLLWIATAIAASTFWTVYDSPRFVLMVAVTTVVGSLIAVVGATYRLPVHLIVVAAIVAYLLLGVPLAVPAEAAFGVLPTIDGLVQLAVGTALGWKQLLTIVLPVGAFQSLLVPPFVLVLVTVTASLSVALRSRAAESAVLGPIALFIAGIAFGPTTEFLPVTIALTLAATLLLWIVWLRLTRRRNATLVPADVRRARLPADRAATVRTAVSAILIIAIACGGALGASALIPPAQERTVLRSTVVQPFDPREYASPLSGFRSYQEADNAPAAMLTVEGLPVGGRIRIATLDSYNGVVYAVGSDEVTSESGSFTLLPARLDQSGVEGRRVTIDVSVDGYSGVWLPTVGLLETVRFAGTGATSLRESFYYNSTSGTAVVVDGVSAGDRFRLDAVVPDEPGADAIGSLEPGDAPVPEVAALPDELTVTLGRYTAGVEGPGARLAAAIAGLKADGYISHGVSDTEPPSRSGHSADRITELVSEPRMIGDEEQYAVTAALMAGALGFPTRVVMGFAPDVAETGPTVVRGADISAWIEVNTAQDGWVTIDPTPPVREIPEELPEQPTRVARPQQPVPPPVEQPDRPEERPAPEQVQDDQDIVDPLLAILLAAATIAGWLAVIVAIVASPFLAIIARKWARRRGRRRAGTPLERVVGGWNEFEDAVLDHGFAVPPSPTRSEFASVVGGPRPLVLAAATDQAVFAPGGPQADEADRVWQAVRDLDQSLGAGLTRWQRVKALVSLRSFRAHAAPRVRPQPARSSKAAKSSKASAASAGSAKSGGSAARR